MSGKEAFRAFAIEIKKGPSGHRLKIGLSCKRLQFVNACIFVSKGHVAWTIFETAPLAKMKPQVH
jgi:hypothetical protein